MDNKKTRRRSKLTAKLEPLGERLVIKPSEIPEVSQGGIILPDTDRERPQEGKVMAAGHGKLSEEGYRIPLEVKAVDRVIYSRFRGTEAKLTEDRLPIMPERDIPAIKIDERTVEAAGLPAPVKRQARRKKNA